ncbi:hypothetical protein D3C81_1570520 [compost metagenome]
MQHKIGTAKVAILIDIIHHAGNCCIPVHFRVIVPVKALQAQLAVAPVTDNIIVTVQHLAVTPAKRLRVPSVFMIEHQLVTFSTYNDQACVACLSFYLRGSVNGARHSDGFWISGGVYRYRYID